MFLFSEAVRGYTIGLCVEKAWRLDAECANGHMGGWSTAELGNFPTRLSLAALAKGLVCSKCQSREGVLHLRQDHAATMGRQMADYALRVAGK